MPNEILGIISDKLPIKSLVQLSRVSSSFQRNTVLSIIKWAKRNGYRGENLTLKGAQSYLFKLHNLFVEIVRLPYLQIHREVKETLRFCLFKKKVFFIDLDAAVSQLRANATPDLIQRIYLSCSSKNKKIFPYFALSISFTPPEIDYSHTLFELNLHQEKAVRRGDLIAVRLFAKLGAEMNRTTIAADVDRLGTLSYLQYAAGYGTTALIDTLLECRAKLNAINDISAYTGQYNPQTALFLAVAKRRILNAQRLLEHGADPNVLCLSIGIPVLMMSIHQRTTAITELLLRYRADPNCVSKNGISPLHLAVRRRKGLETRKLLAAGGDPNLKTGGGETAFDIAARIGDQSIMQLLQPYWKSHAIG